MSCLVCARGWETTLSAWRSQRRRLPSPRSVWVRTLARSPLASAPFMGAAVGLPLTCGACQGRRPKRSAGFKAPLLKLWLLRSLVLRPVILLGLVGSLLCWPLGSLARAESVVKQGEVNPLSLLQTRARLTFQPTEMFYLGMWQDRFLAYARENNWQTVEQVVDPADGSWRRWELVPGGEAVYTPQPQLERVYARGFRVQAYFEGDRLTGLRLVRHPQEPDFNLVSLYRLIRAWFPDNRLLVRYQFLPQDTSRQILSALIGEVPPLLPQDIEPLDVPFCQSLFVPNNPVALPIPSLDIPSHCARVRIENFVTSLNESGR